MKNAIKTIKGISPITRRPFNQADDALYGWMKCEGDLKIKFGHIDAFDYADILKEFREFKKFNTELIENPRSEIERISFKSLKESDLFRKF
jgi:hypothetical protein